MRTVRWKRSFFKQSWNLLTWIGPILSEKILRNLYSNLLMFSHGLGLFWVRRFEEDLWCNPKIFLVRFGSERNDLYTWLTYIALAIWTGWLFRVLPQWGVLFFPFYSSKEKRGKRRITDGMERKEESGRWGSMSISPYMSVIKTTKRLVIRFYSGRILDLFQLDSILKCQYNWTWNSCMLLDQNQNN